MTTKTINGAYAGGYYLDPSFQTLDIGTGAYVGLLGVSTTAMAPSTINNLGTVTGSHDAITLADGGRITNGGPGHSNALIKGFAPIVDADASAVTVVNDGSIISTSQNTASFTNTTYVSIVLNGGGAITNATAGEISSGVILGATATITNSGFIGAPGVYYGKSAAHTNTYTTSMSASVVMLAGGTVINEKGGTVAEGVSISDRGGTIANDGHMGGAYVMSGYSNTAKGESGGAGSSQAAVSLAAGGVVTNAASADLAGVVILNAAGTVTNLGDLTATGSSYFFDSAYNENSSSGVGWGVKLEDGGRVTNGSAVDTIAQAGAVTIAGAIGIVANSGTIGAETAQAGQAVYVMGYPGHFETTTDSETIAASVALGKGGRITNGSTADTQAVLASYVMISGGAGTLNNYGAVGAGYYYTFDSAGPTKERELSVQMTGGGMVRNGAASDTLAALPGGVSIAGGRGGVINYGTVGNTSDVLAGGGTYFSYSIALAMGGSVTNGSSAEPSGLIRNGVAIYGGAGTVTNSGAIQLNTPSPGYAEAAVALRNGGRITNGAATVKTASISGAVGVILTGAGTVTNFGTIASTTAGGNAVSFGATADMLMEEGSGVLTGKVVGAGGALILAAAAGTGTIAGLGATLTGFRAITVQAGAAWRFSGANTIAASTSLVTAAEIVDGGVITNLGTVSLGAVLALSTGATLTNAAGGRLLVTAGPGVALVAGATGTSLVNAGLLDKTSGSGVSSITTAIANTGQIVVAGGTLNLDGAVTGAGTMTIDAGCALEIKGAAAAGGKVDFDGANGVLELGAAASFAGVVRGFGAGDSLDLRSVAFGASETLAYAGGATSGKLTVTSGAQTVRIALFGQYVAASFKAANDGHGGTDITFMAAPAIAPTLANPVLGS